MMAFVNNLVELAKSVWNLFCMAPVTGILLVIAFAVMVFFACSFIKDVIWTDKGGPIILR